MLTLLLQRRHEVETSTSTSLVTIVVVVAVAVAIAGRVVTHVLDGNRIRRYAEEQGWQLNSCSWRPFGPGWFGTRYARIYAINYTDREGRSHSAFAKTSALAGVYVNDSANQ